MGGSCQMLTFDDKGGGGVKKNPKTCLRNTWMFPSKKEKFLLRLQERRKVPIAGWASST